MHRVKDKDKIKCFVLFRCGCWQHKFGDKIWYGKKHTAIAGPDIDRTDACARSQVAKTFAKQKTQRWRHLNSANNFPIQARWLGRFYLFLFLIGSQEVLFFDWWRLPFKNKILRIRDLNTPRVLAFHIYFCLQFLNLLPRRRHGHVRRWFFVLLSWSGVVYRSLEH